MRVQAFVILGLVAALAGCTTDRPYREPNAPPTTSKAELPGTSSESDLSAVTAERYVDDVYLGHRVDPTGEIPQDQRSERFRKGEDVVIGMEVTDAPAGSAIRVTVQSADSEQQVWTAERPVPAGQTHMHFDVDENKLSQGKYRAKVIIGDETVAERDFEVS